MPTSAAHPAPLPYPTAAPDARLGGNPVTAARPGWANGLEPPLCEPCRHRNSRLHGNHIPAHYSLKVQRTQKRHTLPFPTAETPLKSPLIAGKRHSSVRSSPLPAYSVTRYPPNTQKAVTRLPPSYRLSPSLPRWKGLPGSNPVTPPLPRRYSSTCSTTAVACRSAKYASTPTARTCSASFRSAAVS